MEYKTEILLDGLRFGEGPRWRENKLWFSDMHSLKVMTVDLDGRTEEIVQVPNQPSGLGWLPDGRLLVVSMLDRKLLRLDPNGLTEAADISNLASHYCNDMVVDNQGRAYIGNFGSAYSPGSPPGPAEIVMVRPDGTAEIVADEVMFPNGTVITPDGKTMIVGETFAARLTAFDIDENGRLINRRLWAQMTGGAIPDGICLDQEGGIWVASPRTSEAVRLVEGGTITDTVKIDTQAFACMLGGPERKTLFVLTAESSSNEESAKNATGRIEIVDVAVPGAGLP